ncbi:MAG: hypothetical protein ACREX4_11005 [Gammaproteobacteria bacterium]
MIAANAYFLFWRFPEVANHVNLMIFSNFALIFGIVGSYFRSNGVSSDDNFYRMIQPILRLLIIVTFSVAGFHKLNYDFLNPSVSCIRVFGGIIRSMLMSDFLGMGVSVLMVLSSPEGRLRRGGIRRQSQSARRRKNVLSSRREFACAP